MNIKNPINFLFKFKKIAPPKFLVTKKMAIIYNKKGAA